jgi:hypothetical protein
MYFSAVLGAELHWTKVVTAMSGIAFRVKPTPV